MLTWIVIIVILCVLIVFFTCVFALLFARGEQHPPMPSSVVVIRHNRKALRAGSIDDLMFDTVFRGYRQDQVDDVIMTLNKQLEELKLQIASRGDEK